MTDAREIQSKRHETHPNTDLSFQTGRLISVSMTERWTTFALFLLGPRDTSSSTKSTAPIGGMPMTTKPSQTKSCSRSIRLSGTLHENVERHLHV